LKYAFLGGAGFIGKNYINYLSENGTHEIFVLDNLSMGNNLVGGSPNINLSIGDASNVDEVFDFLARSSPDIVFHFAANSDIAASALNPLLDVKDTLMTTVALASAIEKIKVRTVVFSSSSAIFGNVQGPISSHTSPMPQSAYGYMKLASELLLQKLLERGLVESLFLLRFPNVTGPFQTHGVVRDLVQRLLDSPIELNVLGNGSQTKPFIRPLDLVEIIERLIAANSTGLVKALIGPSTRTSVKKIVEILVEESGITPEISFGSSAQGWPGDVPEYSFDCSETESLIGPLGLGDSDGAVRESIRWELQMRKMRQP
jgi:UDP-glucose 4-epimerase